MRREGEEHLRGEVELQVLRGEGEGHLELQVEVAGEVVPHLAREGEVGEGVGHLRPLLVEEGVGLHLLRGQRSVV